MADFSQQSSHLVFVIGGSYGLSPRVKAAGDLQLSFGKMTLPHQLARLVLLEQIYRACAINTIQNIINKNTAVRSVSSRLPLLFYLLFVQVSVTSLPLLLIKAFILFELCFSKKTRIFRSPS